MSHGKKGMWDGIQFWKIQSATESKIAPWPILELSQVSLTTNTIRLKEMCSHGERGSRYNFDT